MTFFKNYNRHLARPRSEGFASIRGSLYTFAAAFVLEEYTATKRAWLGVSCAHLLRFIKLSITPVLHCKCMRNILAHWMHDMSYT